MAQELKDWEENPHLYLQDNEGNFVLKKDGTPRKKSGRPALKDEAKFAAHRAISRKQKNIKKRVIRLELCAVGRRARRAVSKKLHRHDEANRTFF